VRYPKAFEALVAYLRRFPGIGRRSAERYVFDMLHRWDRRALQDFAKAIVEIANNIEICERCKVHIEKQPCPFCSEDRLVTKALCIVPTSKEAYALEEAGLFEGAYFVVGSLISPLDQRGIGETIIQDLHTRITADEVEEVIFVFDSSVEGDATISFLKEELSSLPIIFSRLASGVPVGAPLEFVDRGTLGRAFAGRQKV
jgi:recombination protein RecR